MANKLTGVHPDLVRLVGKLQMGMTALGFPMIVTDGVRTAAEQRALWLKGRNQAGQVIDRKQVVTHADGTTARSNHQTHTDGFGHAVDLTFLDLNGKPRWVDTDPWAVYGALAKFYGLKWGGDWPSDRVDQPHVELP